MQSSLRVLIGALVCFFANIELSKGQSLSNKFTLPQKGLSLDLKWKGEFGHEYLLEVSQNPDFPGNETQKFKVTGYRYTLRLKSEGSFYWKVSLFDKTRSPASDENFPDKKVRNFFVQKPKKLSHPKGIWIGRWIMNPRLPKVVRWEKDPRAVNYRLEVFNFDGTEKLFSTKSFQNSYTFEDFVSHDEGYYLVRVASVDRYGWQGEFSKCRYTYVGNPRRKKAAPKVNLDLACLDRNPAANPKLTTQIEGHKTIGRNKLYSNSQVQIEGASFLVGSIADSDAEDQELASAMVTSLRGMYWLNHRHGFEGIFKTKLVGYNEQGNNLSPTNLEARYHMRWTGPSFWKSLFREFQFSAFAGYEVYKNSVKNGANFTSSYDLFKIGGTISLPLFYNWETGGEIAYGYGANSSSKLEMKGYLNYYLSKKWSVGGGYKVSLFSAGEISQSPDGILPYREAYLELFGSLKYSF